MYLCNLKIRNFRNFRKANIDLKSEDNILIGENGCGKTNLLSAIRLVLDYTYRLENYLNLGDFNKKINYKNFGEWIIISAKFTDFNEIESGIGIHDFCLDEKKDSYINFFFKPKEKVLDSIYNKYQEYLNNFNNILHGTNANTSKGATGPSLFGHGFADVSASSSTTCAGNRNN